MRDDDFETKDLEGYHDIEESIECPDCYQTVGRELKNWRDDNIIIIIKEIIVISRRVTR